VMEQQTVSIAKAGITTTLNARTAVVAAANPVYGRWDKRKSLEANLGLPTSLLSRFDLSFIILDRAQMQNDLDLASHVTHVHMTSEPRPSRYTPLTSTFLRSYIAYSRRYSPYVPRALQEEIVGHYLALRKDDDHHLSASTSSSNNRQRFVTPRSLLSILRLAQAHARLHLQKAVRAVDIGEAIRLLYVSKRSEEEDEDAGPAGGVRGRDPISEIYHMCMQAAQSTGRNDVNKAEMERAALSRGYTAAQFIECLDVYERLNVWMVQGSKVHILTGRPGQNRGGEEEDEDEDMEEE
jgi:DNA replication licensing factor MCM7